MGLWVVEGQDVATVVPDACEPEQVMLLLDWWKQRLISDPSEVLFGKVIEALVFLRRA